MPLGPAAAPPAFLTGRLLRGRERPVGSEAHALRGQTGAQHSRVRSDRCAREIGLDAGLAHAVSGLTGELPALGAVGLSNSTAFGGIFPAVQPPQQSRELVRQPQGPAACPPLSLRASVRLPWPRFQSPAHQTGRAGLPHAARSGVSERNVALPASGNALPPFHTVPEARPALPGAFSRAGLSLPCRPVTGLPHSAGGSASASPVSRAAL